jgi:hypothetical protein
LEFIIAKPDVQDVLHHSTCTSPYNYVGSVMEQILYIIWEYSPLPLAARSKAWVCGRSPAEIAGSNPTSGMDVCLL